MTLYINLQTGESYESKSRCEAVRYFKNDAKRWKYKLKLKNIVTLRKYLLTL